MKLVLVSDDGVRTELRKIGSTVHLADDLEGLVVAASFEDDRVQYSVAWIHNGDRRTAWITALELELRDPEVAT